MMQNAVQTKTNETQDVRRVEIDESSQTPPLVLTNENSENMSNSPSAVFVADTSSDEDEASEVDSFILDESGELDEDQILEPSQFLLPAETGDPETIQAVDPETHARLEALLEAAGISKLSSKDGKALTDPEVLRTLTSSVSSALDEAAQALHRMRAEHQVQVTNTDRRAITESGEPDASGMRKLEGVSFPEPIDGEGEGESLLSLACSAGYYELAQVLLAMKANVEDRGIKGDCTPLMEAASGGHADIVRLLIAHNADVNAQSSAGNTPLHYAACGGYVEVVRELIKAHSNVEVHNENGHTPLMEAASAGHVEVAKTLLQNGAGINTHSNEFKESALTLACYKGHLNMVKYLLEAGADREHKTDEMHTALMEASMDGHVEVARLLLDNGAQVNMPADSFESPLTLAACGGHVELACLLLDRGANIEEVNDEGYTPLMEAAREGHEDMVGLLLAHDADINAQTEETQETALTLACCGGFLEVADFIIKAGADIELGCSTPLMEASQEGHLELVKYLLKCGANVHTITGTGDTALTYACENGHTDVAEVLLEAGAELEHESEGGRTPLMKAARAGHFATVQYLITKGADLNRSTSTNDHTVLSLACAGGHMTVVELLLAHNADSHHRLKDGSTMIIEAAKGGHTNVVKLLLDWPNRQNNMITSPDSTQLNHIDLTTEEPRVPLPGLVNIVPPSEPDSQIPIAPVNFTPNIQAKNLDQVRANMQKSVAKRSLNQAPEVKVIKQTNNPVPLGEITPPPEKKISEQYPNEKATEKVEAIINNIVNKEINSVPAASKEEQILRKQQILAELQKVERELHEKAQQQREHQQQHRDQQQQVIARIRHAAGVSPDSTQSPPLPALPALPPTTDINTLGVQTDLPFSDLINPKSPKSMADLPVVSQPVISYADTSFIPQPIFTPGSNPPITDTRAPAGGKNAQTKRNGSVKPRTKSLIGVIQPSLPSPSIAADQNGVSSSTDPPSLTASCANQLQLQQQQQQSVQPVMLDPNRQQQQPLQVLTPQNIPFPNFQLTPQQQGQLLQHMLQSQNFPQQPIPQQTLQLLPQTPTSIQSPTSQALNQVQLAQTPVNLAHQNQLVQTVCSSSQQSLQLPTQQQTTSVIQTTSLAQHATLQLAQQQPLPNQAPVVSQQIFTHQQQQQFMQQQAQQIQLQQQQYQLQQEQLKQQQPQPNNKQIYRKQQLVVQQNPNGQTMVQSSSIMGVEAITPPPSIPLTPTPSPASPQSLTPVLSSSVDVDAHTESNHDTALTLACAGGHTELVTLLLAKGANLEHRDKKGFTPLILAATAGHVDVVEILLESRSEIEAQSERTKDTPLSLACSGGRFEVVELLLAKGANKEHRNVSDYTPLSLAASGGYVSIIKLLLNHGAEINSRTGSKLGISPLMLAAMNGHLAAVKLLLDMGSDINAQIETNRNTALTLACFQGRHEVVSLLVDRKANIEHRAKTGLTPLMEAASGGYVEVGQVLIDKNADVNAPPVPSSRDTALTIAADKGHYKFVELLILKNCQIEVKNKKGNSPLWLACAGGHLDVAQLLVQHGASIDSMDNRKVSCLMASFRKGHTKIVKWLVKLVSQFPSDTELQKYIATVTDKELQQRCEQCMEAIISAKNWQAEEANKNANILLEELDKERQEMENKKAVQAKKRERKRMKNKKKNKETNKKDDENKYSSPEPDSCESVHNEVEKIEQEIVKLVTPVATTTSTIGTTLPTTTEPTVARPRKARLPPTSSLEARKNRKNRREERERQLEKRNAVPKTSCNWKSSVATTSLTITTTSNVITTICTSTVSTTSSSSNNNNKERSKHKNDIVYKSNHNTGIDDLDDFGTIPSNLKLPDKEIQKLTKKLDKIKINNVVEKSNSAGSHSNQGSKVNNQSTSPKKGQKKEDGWKEVVRKVPPVSKSKKVLVPSSAISRVIGRGGCNINAIRDVSGAHVEVEKQKGLSERAITIKGTAEATRQACFLITSLVQEPEKELVEIINESKADMKIDKPPVIDTFSPDMPIGTFNAASVSHTNNNNTPSKSSRNSEGRQGMGTPTHSNKMNSQPPMSVSVWQDPNPAPHPSPRKSPLKNFISQPSTNSFNNGDRNGMHSHGDRHHAPSVTVSSTTVSHSSNQMKVVVTASTVTGPRPDSRNQMSSKTPTKQPNPIRVLQRPGSNKPEHQPLPIVTSHASHTVTPGTQHVHQQPISPATTPGEYYPFNNLFNSDMFLKKDDKMMNFASVAKAGVVVSTTSNVVNNNHNNIPQPQDQMLDPALQAKAPGFKIGRTASPQFRQEHEIQVPTNIRNFHIALNPMNEPDFGRSSAFPDPRLPPSMPSGMHPGLPGGMAPGLPTGLQPGMQPTMQSGSMQSVISPRSNTSTPSGLSPRSQSSLEMSQQSLASITSQKDEYSTPNQPMTLPEIKSTLNPNAPDFHINQTMPGMENIGMGMQPNMQRSPRVPSLHANSAAFQQQMLLINAANNINLLNPKNPTDINTINTLIQRLAASQSINQAPSGFNPPVPQLQRALSPMMQTIGRPNSAPSIGGMQERAPPGNEVKQSVEDRRVPRPIGVERAHRKTPARSSMEFPSGRDISKFWDMNSEINPEWVPSTTNLMTAASMTSSVMTSSVITGGNMVYNLNSLPGGGPPTNEPPHERSSFHDSIPQNMDSNMPQVAMFTNGHYPQSNQHNMMAQRGLSGGDNLPNLWNTGMKQPPPDTIDNGTWAWSQQQQGNI